MNPDDRRLIAEALAGKTASFGELVLRYQDRLFHVANRVVDNPDDKEYPLPLYVAGKYHCEVGRLRKDCAMDNGLCFWVVGDQLLKGAALNAVQIAEELMK